MPNLSMIRYIALRLKKSGYMIIKYFLQIYRGTNSIQARSITCANLVLDRMEYAGGRLYVAKYFDENSKKAVKIIIMYQQIQKPIHDYQNFSKGVRNDQFYPK